MMALAVLLATGICGAGLRAQEVLKVKDNGVIETAPGSFDSYIGMNCPPPNWNEGLDQELTKDLHLIQAFHYLFDHTKFAITDFIYVREFETEINVETNKTIKR